MILISLLLYLGASELRIPLQAIKDNLFTDSTLSNYKNVSIK